jgi:hypothetical protein
LGGGGGGGDLAGNAGDMGGGLGGMEKHWAELAAWVKGTSEVAQYSTTLSVLLATRGVTGAPVVAGQYA